MPLTTKAAPEKSQNTEFWALSFANQRINQVSRFIDWLIAEFHFQFCLGPRLLAPCLITGTLNPNEGSG
jgi:hypothetical protein